MKKWGGRFRATDHSMRRWQCSLNCNGDATLCNCQKGWVSFWGRLLGQSQEGPKERLCCSRQQIWVGSKPLGAQRNPSPDPDIEHRAEGMLFTLLGFLLILVWPVLIFSLFPTFGIQLFLLCHCMLDVMWFWSKGVWVSQLNDSVPEETLPWHSERCWNC